MRIEEELGSEAVYAGANFRNPVEPYESGEIPSLRENCDLASGFQFYDKLIARTVVLLSILPISFEF